MFPKKNIKGQILVMAVLLLFAVVVFSLTLVNITRAIDAKIRLQTSADAAAITGAIWQARCYNQIASLNTAGQEAEHCYHIIKYYLNNNEIKKLMYKIDVGVVTTIGLLTPAKFLLKLIEQYPEPSFSRGQAEYLKIRAVDFNLIAETVAKISLDFIPQEVYRTGCINITNGMDGDAKLEIKNGEISEIRKPYGALIMDQKSSSAFSVGPFDKVPPPAKRSFYSKSDFVWIKNEMISRKEKRRNSFSFENKYFTVLAWDKRPFKYVGSGFFDKLITRGKTYALASSMTFFDADIQGHYLDTPIIPLTLKPGITKVPFIQYFYPKWDAKLCPVETSAEQLTRFHEKINLPELVKEYESYKKTLYH